MGYDLSGRVVALTGSTGGLGSALARALRLRGARLALFDLGIDDVTAQAAALGTDAVAAGWAADVRDFDSVRAAMDAAARHFGRIDVVVANAGIGSMAPLATLDPEVATRVVDINLNGVWRTFRAGLPYVTEQRGYLLAISSMAAFVHSPLNGPYTASKAGVWALCDSTRLEVRHLGVGVGSVHPTFFATPMMDRVRRDPAGRALWAGNERGLWKMVPIERVVRDIVTGIERRSDFLVIPRRNALFARIPGLIRPVVDRIGFPGRTVVDAIEQASASGWND
ncbi:SDR family NAD(P)-dependent oxidoreductase [Nocardia higoensis]|uniref:SDR family NAD(P)-dependent oxidoreductase n=1 Tax=Nocardia higoensis TaxID=228599 RepID=UPI00031D74E8|nr:SDR family NAD(P)-dependent oxidoreductase [Nocardia higoensis]